MTALCGRDLSSPIGRWENQGPRELMSVWLQRGQMQHGYTEARTWPSGPLLPCPFLVSPSSTWRRD